MRSGFVSNGLVLLTVLATSTLPVLGLPTEQYDPSTSLNNTIGIFHETRSLNGDFTIRYSHAQQRDLDENAPLLDGLEKRKGGHGSSGGGRGSSGGSRGGSGGKGSSSAGGKGDGVGGREGGAPGKGAGSGPARGQSPNEVTGMRGGRGSGYGVGGRGAGFAGAFLGLAFLTLLFVDVAANLCLDAAYIYLLTAMVGYELSDTVKYMPGFQNSDTDKWPRYDQRPPTTVTGTDGKPHDVSAQWSIRIFSDDSCGSNGNDPYHTGKGKHGAPTMMGEIISTDLNYHDGKACQNFMVDVKSPIVQSVAVWFDPKYATPPNTPSANTNPNQGIISLYSHPLCSTILDPSRTSANAPNGTVHTTYSDDFPDYMQVYTGNGLVNGAGTEQTGVWSCYQMQVNSFHVVFSGITDNKATLTGPDGAIASGDTLPPANKPGEQDVYADRHGGTYLTTDISKTFQVTG